MRTGAASAVGARRHNENDVTMTIAGLWRYGDWRHVATGCTPLVLYDACPALHRLVIIWFYSYLLILWLSTIYGTEWPIMCWCAVKKLLTDSHSLAPAGWPSRCTIKRHRFHSKTRNSPLEVEPATFTTHFSRLRNHTAAVTYLELWIQVCFSILFVFGCRYDTAGHPSKYWVLVSSCDREHWPMALAFKFDLNRVKINQHGISS